MKLTKSLILKMIKEKMEAEMGGEDSFGDTNASNWKAGDYLEVSISDDGYETNVKKINPSNFTPDLDYKSFKALVKIEKVAG